LASGAAHGTGEMTYPTGQERARLEGATKWAFDLLNESEESLSTQDFFSEDGELLLPWSYAPPEVMQGD
jgi:hypothetical protein